MKTSVVRSALVLLLLVLTVLSGLTRNGRAQGSSHFQSLNAHQDKTIYHPTGSEGTITGNIEFIGVPPTRAKIDMYADPVCAEMKSEKLTESVLVTDDKLANVFVYVKAGRVLDLYEFEAPSGPVVLERKECSYVPRVVGVRVGQTLQVLNRDLTAHNTHARATINPARNTSQPPGGDAIEWKFTKPEYFIPFKCNQHPWEKAYVGVVPHPYFSVSADNGSYKIEGLPTGAYTIVAWHEKYGEKSIDITIAPHESKTLNFGFEEPKDF